MKRMKIKADWFVVLAVIFLAARTESAAMAETPPPAANPLEANAALVYWQAFAQLPNQLPDDGLQKMRAALFSPTTCPVDSAVEELCKRADISLRALHRGASLEKAAWALDTSAGEEVSLPHVFEANRLGKYATLRARLRFSQGQHADAVTDLLDMMRMARHIGVDPYFACLSEQLGMEDSALMVAADNLMAMDQAALKKLSAGLDSLPVGGSIASVMAQKRQRIAALIKELTTAEDKAVPEIVGSHLGSSTTKALLTATENKRDKLTAYLNSIATLADRSAKAVAIPNQKIDLFYAEVVSINDEASKLGKDFPPVSLALAYDAVDRYLEARVQAKAAMVQAAIAFRLGGKDALAKVADPFGDGPFELKEGDKGLEIVSKLKIGNNPPVSLSFPSNPKNK